MTDPKLLQVVREVIAEVAQRNDFNDNTPPISGLGLASVDGPQVAVCLEIRLGIKIPNKLNPLVDDDRRRERTISEIAAWLSGLQHTTEVKHGTH